MQYRSLGKTGISVSIIGHGLEFLDGKPYSVVDKTINTALDKGINIFDVFMPGEEIRKNIGKVLAGKRDKVFLQGHLCSTDINQQYDRSRDLPTVKKYFENLLRFLGTDYIDFGMMFFIDSEADYKGAFESPVLEYALGLKEKGVIRHLGASSHVAATAKRAVQTGLVDLLMFSLNPAFDMVPGQKDITSERAELYRLCESQGVGITVMKALGGGRLLSPSLSPFAQPMTVGQCIHYALSQPAVASALVGCQSPEQIEETISYLSMTDMERDYSHILGSMKTDFRGKCYYCRHCLPCPSEIDIARIHRIIDTMLGPDEKNIPPDATEYYNVMSSFASDCIFCGSCEERCPFGTPVRKNMERAAALFGK